MYIANILTCILRFIQLALYVVANTAVIMAKLVLEDGTEIIGDSFGHNSAASGEIGNNIQLYMANFILKLLICSFSNWNGWICGIPYRSFLLRTDSSINLSTDWELRNRG